MHRLSIVIPCQLFDQHAEDTLVSVLQHRPEHCQVLLVTAGKYGDPYDLADEVDFVDEDPRATLPMLANRGFREACGEVAHLLQPGALVVDGWTDRVLGHFDDPHVGSVSPAVVRSLADDRALWLGVGYWTCGVRRIVGRGARLSGQRAARAHVLGPSFVAGFYRRDAVVAVSGFDERMEPSCADVELGLAMRALQQRSVVEPACRVMSRGPAVFPAGGFQTARHLECIYRRYPPAGLMRRLAHAMVAAWDVVGCFPQPRMMTRLAGRLVARCEPGIRKLQAQRLGDAAARLARSAEAARPIAIRVDFSDRLPTSATAAPRGHRAA